ncbi:MAG: 7,8-didemethyl-8-hydroxy-5-deazariboflavin synthase subunit CofG [Gammaproteobacteria bacterium]|nr:MAG: 7,8-didemethyl-8-hydroxy-5-deazariboflavin synthase subunit CofG [Gammaproteobacteria bacterium]
MTHLSSKQAKQYEHINEQQLAELMAQAASVRDAAWGKTMTYSRKVFIPLTNYCRDECKYCTFVKRPGDVNANIMTPAQVLSVAKQGQVLGCKEALFSLGEKPELRYREVRQALKALGYNSMVDYLVAMCDLVVAQTTLIPHVNAGNLTAAEFSQLKAVSGSMGLMLESVSDELHNKGAAHFACPDKIPALRLETIKQAGLQHIPFTTGILIGIGETWADRVDSLVAINQLQQKQGHIQEVIVQNFCAKPDTEMANHPEPSITDMLKTLAVARLILDPAISLQAPPNLQQNHADYIAAGINDWGGISPLTQDFINPDNAWPQINNLAKSCQQQGFTLQERLTVYPKYFSKKSEQLSDVSQQFVRSRLIAMARIDGLAQQQVVQCDHNESINEKINKSLNEKINEKIVEVS